MGGSDVSTFRTLTLCLLTAAALGGCDDVGDASDTPDGFDETDSAATDGGSIGDAGPVDAARPDSGAPEARESES